MLSLKSLALILYVFLQVLTIGYGQEQFTPAETEALEMFRPMVSKYLKSDFMKSDGYLIQWLRDRNLDLTSAKSGLLNTLKWRKDNNMDRILSEDFSEFEKKYPFNVDGVDKEGRPILIAPAGSWRPRQAVLAGQLDKYNRFMTRTMLEIPFKRIEEQYGKQNTDGKNVSQYLLVMDLHGINGREHLCLQCIQIYATLMTNAEKYYPRLALKTFFINTPRIFDTVLSVIRPLMSDFSRENLNVLDHNRDKWQAQLQHYIDPEQLPPRYGGTKDFKPDDYYGQSYEALSQSTS